MPKKLPLYSLVGAALFSSTFVLGGCPTAAPAEPDPSPGVEPGADAGPAAPPDAGADAGTEQGDGGEQDGGSEATDSGQVGTDGGEGPADGGETRGERPNVLLVIADDLGVDASGQYPYGTDLPFTPTLDGLAASGVVFDNMWATPSCTTTRGTIITGEFGVHSGVDFVPAVLPPGSEVLQAALAEDSETEAYRSGVFGKWHLGGGTPPANHPQQFGIDPYAGNLRGVLDAYDDWELTVDGVTAPETAYHTTKITDLALDWIEEQGAAPWFAWVAYSAPHGPFHLPPPEALPSPAQGIEALTGTAEHIEANRRAYYLAMIQSLDFEIGRMLDTLAPEVRENTVVIVLGDNGTAGPVIDTSVFPRTHAKNSLYEGGIRVPMIIAGAGVTRRGERERALVNSVDLFATIQELSGATEPGTQDSMSFAGRLTDAAAAAREMNYVEFVGANVTGWATRDARYKLIVSEGGTEELYDLENDLREENNLIGDESLINVATALRLYGLGVRDETPAGGVVDITNAIFSGRDASCAEYVENYGSHVTDVGRALAFEGSLSVTLSGDKCVFASNGIPNHDFNDLVVNGQNVQFPNAVSEQSQVFEMPQSPSIAGGNSPLLLTQDNGVLLNGVKVDLLAAGCFGVGDGRVGCNDINQPWRYDPLYPTSGFRVDSHNAHSQPNGAYHYHGPPRALYVEDGSAESGLIGFAADGFPIFGTFIERDGAIEEVQSSYRLREDNGGNRPMGGADPGGSFDGTFRDDYVYVPGAGDLDECNGMTTPDGVYGYYVTNAYPWVMACFKGTPDPTFNK